MPLLSLNKLPESRYEVNQTHSKNQQATYHSSSDKADLSKYVHHQSLWSERFRLHCPQQLLINISCQSAGILSRIWQLVVATVSTVN
jgi:hypothetical protein